MSVLGNTIAGDIGTDFDIQPQGNGPDLDHRLSQQQCKQPHGTGYRPTGTAFSGLLAVLGAVAKVGATGLAAGATKPASGRASFASGLGAGAQAEANQIAQDQAIRFKTFDDSIRAASLHNQDKELQLRTQAQNDAHQAAQDAQHDWDSEHGIQYDEVPNSGDAALNYLKAQTSANGAASSPSGTHLSADGKTILVPRPSDELQAGQMQKYNTFSAAYGLPALPQGAQFAPPKYLDMLQHRMEGHKLSGDVYNHDDLPGAIADLQATRDSMAKKGSSPAVLTQVDATIGSMKAKLDFLDKHKTDVLQAAENVKNSPESIAGDARKAAAVAAAQQPFKIAEKKLEQALKDGDPNTAGQMLAAGDIAPSQIISTRNPSFAQQAYAAAKAADPNYNPQRAEGEFKVANSPTNLGFFGSAKSLTDTGGTLDQLQAAYNKLPNGQVPKLNKVSDWTAAAAGSGATAGFAQTAIGVADDYAKVMGGGQGSDTSREQVLKTFSAASSPEQIQAAISAARAAVGSQMSSRIGSNKAMQRMYGQNVPGISQGGSQSGKAVSLSAAKQLPAMQGKSDAQITQAIQAQGHQVIP